MHWGESESLINNRLFRKNTNGSNLGIGRKNLGILWGQKPWHPLIFWRKTHRRSNSYQSTILSRKMQIFMSYQLKLGHSITEEDGVQNIKLTNNLSSIFVPISWILATERLVKLLTNGKWEMVKEIENVADSHQSQFDQSKVTPKRSSLTSFTLDLGYAINLKIADSNQIGQRSSKDVRICWHKAL